MAKKSKGYLNSGWGKLLNIILAIIPVTSWLLGGITRIQRGHMIAGVLQLLGIGQILFFWVDIVTVILKGDLTFCA